MKAEGSAGCQAVNERARVGRVGIGRVWRCCISATAFPIGAFAYSDGLEAAAARGGDAASDLRAWMDVCLDETLGRMDGPAVWQAWPAFRDCRLGHARHARRRAHRAAALVDRQALEPRHGARLLTTWQALHPDPRIERAAARASATASARRCRSRLPARARARASTGGAPSRRSRTRGSRRQSRRRCG